MAREFRPARTSAATRFGLGAIAAGLVTTWASPLLAAPSDAELASEVRALKAELRDLQVAIDRTRKDARHKKVASPKGEAPSAVPAAAPAYSIPPGATPAFITADKGLAFGAITITPGGFIAAESVFRSRTTQSDMDTDFRAIPFGNSPLAHMNEARFSSRQTRVALLAESAITPTFVVAGYMEFDFRSAANTANANEANGWTPRIRNLYATLDNSDYAMHVLAGQNWSLAVLNSKGITPRNEVTPSVIEGKYVPGFVSPRQNQIRLTKDFGEKLWLSLSAEEAQTTFVGGCAGAGAAGPQAPTAGAPVGTFGNGTTIGGITCGAGGTGGGFAGQTVTYSLNHVPDVIAKAAYELRIGERNIHLESFGMYRDFYDRVAYTNNLGIAANTNRDTTGYGVGAGLIVPVVPRKLDFQASGLYGRGVGRYGTSQLADTTFNPDGSLRPLQEGMLLGGVIVHATPAIDVYAFSGIEKSFRTYNQNYTAAGPSNTFYGLGAPGAVTANVQGCSLEPNAAAQYNPVGACTSTGNGNIKQIFQLTGGIWDNIYKGSFGQVRVGLQYSFTERQIYNNAPGVLQTTGQFNGVPVYTNNYQPKAIDHMIFTSIRYFPFL